MLCNVSGRQTLLLNKHDDDGDDDDDDDEQLGWTSWIQARTQAQNEQLASSSGAKKEDEGEVTWQIYSLYTLLTDAEYKIM